MSESNLRKCKSCKELKNRIQDGKFPNGRDKRWVNENGKQWNGSKCADCVIAKSRETMKKIRAS